MIDPDELSRASERIDAVRQRVSTEVIGQHRVVQQVLVCLLAGGHVLLEGVPGLGKTLLVRALASSFGGSFKRIQFTPDLMPTDVTGHALFNMQSQRFEIRRGPVFANLLLADEINRAPAKTQAALLEVMQEATVTIEGESLAVPEPFMVLATQNPIEQDGTYPLPEAELDRFMMKVVIDYPDADAERALVTARSPGERADALLLAEGAPALEAAGLVELRRTVGRVRVDPVVVDYAVSLCRASRTLPGLTLGAGPRATLALVRASRAAALLEGRDYVVPDDVKSLLPPVLRHRLQLSPEREIEGATADRLLEELLAQVPAPRQ